MITLDEVKDELERRGYSVRLSKVTRNTVEKTCLIVDIGDVSPCFYEENFYDCKTVFDAAYFCEQAIRKSMPNFDKGLLESREWIRKNVYIGLQRKSKENLVKRDCTFFPDPVEEYLYLRIVDDGIGTIKLDHEFLDDRHIKESALWKSAEANTFSDKEFYLTSMVDFLSEGDPNMKEILSKACDTSIYVVTNKELSHGAVQVMNLGRIIDALKPSDIYGKRIVAIPSSIHECILIIRDKDAEDKDSILADINEMIRQVNASEVKPEDVLGNRAVLLK